MNKEDSSSSDYCYFHPKEAVVGVCPLCLHDRLLVLAAAQQRHLSSSTTATPSTTSSSSASAAGRHKKKPSILFALGSLLVNRLEFRHPKSDLHHHHGGDDAHFPDYDYDYDCAADDDASTGTLEDSFISIQFQDNGVASWEKGVDLVSQSKNHDKNKNKKKKDDDDDLSWSNSKKDKKKKKKSSQSHRREPSKKNSSTIIMPFSSSSSSQSCKVKGQQEEMMTMSVVEHGKPRAGSMRWRKRIGHMFHLIRWKRSNSSSRKGNVCHVGSTVEGVKVVSSSRKSHSKGWMRTLTKRRARE